MSPPSGPSCPASAPPVGAVHLRLFLGFRLFLRQRIVEQGVRQRAPNVRNGVFPTFTDDEPRKHTATELESAVRQAWADKPADLVPKLYGSMVRRLTAVQVAKGAATKY